MQVTSRITYVQQQESLSRILGLLVPRVIPKFLRVVDLASKLIRLR